MAGVVAAPYRAKRGRSEVVAFSDFFGAKVKTLLLRTQSVVQTLPAEIRGASAALLTDLGPFADAGSFSGRFGQVGRRILLPEFLSLSLMKANGVNWTFMRDSAKGSSTS
jgi:hypothetical protein